MRGSRSAESEPRQLPGGVDEKQIAGIVEIFSNKLLCRKPKLYLVITGNAGNKYLAVAGLYGQLVLVAQGRVQIAMTCPLHENCCSAAPPGLTVIVSNNRQQTANPLACTMTSLQSGKRNFGPIAPLFGGGRAR